MRMRSSIGGEVEPLNVMFLHMSFDESPKTFNKNDEKVGDKGSPFLMPRDLEKVVEGGPLIRMENYAGSSCSPFQIPSSMLDQA